MENLQTQLLGKRVYLKAEKAKKMNAPMYTIETVYVDSGLKLVISDEYGGVQTVIVDDVELHRPRSW